jgi:hypothetical protein
MLLLISATKLVIEIALLVLLGQWVLGVLVGAKREHNLVWQALQVAGSPFVRVARRLSPRVVLDRHVPLVACLLLGFGWLAVTLAKISHCLKIGVDLCR